MGRLRGIQPRRRNDCCLRDTRRSRSPMRTAQSGGLWAFAGARANGEVAPLNEPALAGGRTFRGRRNFRRGCFTVTLDRPDLARRLTVIPIARQALAAFPRVRSSEAFGRRPLTRVDRSRPAGIRNPTPIPAVRGTEMGQLKSTQSGHLAQHHGSTAWVEPLPADRQR